MNAIVLTAVVLLWWRCGYCHEVCEIKKIENISIKGANDSILHSAISWVEYVDEPSVDSCLRVLVPKDMRIGLYHIQQMGNAYTLGIGQHIMRMAILPSVVDKNGEGIYFIIIGNDSLTKEGCALYDGEKILLPMAPEITIYNLSEIPKNIYQARLEVVETFLKKYDNFTEEQKKKITRFFANGTLYTPSKPSYF